MHEPESNQLLALSPCVEKLTNQYRTSVLAIITPNSGQHKERRLWKKNNQIKASIQDTISSQQLLS